MSSVDSAPVVTTVSCTQDNHLTHNDNIQDCNNYHPHPHQHLHLHSISRRLIREDRRCEGREDSDGTNVPEPRNSARFFIQLVESPVELGGHPGARDISSSIQNMNKCLNKLEVF